MSKKKQAQDAEQPVTLDEIEKRGEALSHKITDLINSEIPGDDLQGLAVIIEALFIQSSIMTHALQHLLIESDRRSKGH